MKCIQIYSLTLVLLIVPLSARDFLDQECRELASKNPDCNCILGTDYNEIQCPPNSDKMVIKIHKPENSSVHLELDCRFISDANVFKDSLPTGIQAGRVDPLRIGSCPLPPEGFRVILQKLGVTDVRSLTFELQPVDEINVTSGMFTDLQSLVKFSFTSNKCRYIELGELPNLELLELAANRINLYPGMFKQNSQLNLLDLSRNQIESIPDGTFSNLTKLRFLELWANKIRSIGERSFEGLRDLTLMELSTNEINDIHEGAFRGLPNLTNLSLRQNNLTVLPENLFSDNHALVYLDIGSNLNLDLSSYEFRGTPLLRHIKLNNCNLKTIAESIFKQTPNLEVINLSHNQIAEIPSSTFSDLVKLTELNLGSNRLKTVEGLFSNLYKLQVLRLEQNMFTEITKPTLKGLYNLEKIHLNNNRINKIRGAFETTTKLTEIYLSYNLLSTLIDPYGSSLFNRCQKLRVLDLRGNELNDAVVVPELVRLKADLQRIDLSINNITSIEISDFLPTYPNSDLEIDLSDNKISQIIFVMAKIEPNLDSIEKLDGRNPRVPTTHISLSNNPLFCDCDAFDLIQYFKDQLDPRLRSVVDIRSDNLKCSGPEFVKDKRVEDVDPGELLCPVNCSSDCACTWRALDESVTADCADRNLTAVPRLDLENNLSYKFLNVYLQNNLLRSFGNESKQFDKVKSLSLANNRLETVDWVPPNLKVLELHNNNLTALPYRILETLNKSIEFRNLTLGGNPWACNCSAQNLTDFLRLHNAKVDSAYILCAESRKELITLNQKHLCEFNKEPILISAVIVVVALLIAVSMAAVYFKFSQEIKVWLYAKNICLWLITEEELDKDKIYDAFVSYSNEDEDFVVQEIVQKLEGGPHKFKLCLHYRDWTAGKFIATQIAESVRDSRRTIIILSKNFLKSVWAKLEFQTAHVQAMKEGRARVVIVLYGDVDTDSLDDELRTYLKTNTYVKWGDPWFWNKLRYALPHTKRRLQSNILQKHSNMMISIDDKFNLVEESPTSKAAVSATTPPILILNPASLKDNPLESGLPKDDSHKDEGLSPLYRGV